MSESLILGTLLTLWHRIRRAYYDSATAKMLARFAAWMKGLASGSSIWNFIRRRDFFSRVWKESAAFRLTDGLLNLPSYLSSKVFYKLEAFFRASLFTKLLNLILTRLEILTGAFLALIFVVPHTRWNNIYNTAIVVLLAFLYFIKTVYKRYERFEVKTLDFALCIFALTVVLATVTSVFPRDSLRFLVFYATCLLLVLFIVSSVKTGRALGLLLEVLLIGITITGLYGIYQAIVGVPVDPALTDVTLNEGLPGRIFSTIGNSNDYAELLVLMLPFYAAVIFNSKTLMKKLVYAALAVPPLLALGLTLTRSAWIAFAVSVFVFVFLKNRKLIPILLILGVLSIPLLPEVIYRRIATIWNPNDTSASYRVKIYQTVLPMLKDYWATGVGLGTDAFMKICQGYYLYTTKTPPHTHNLFLQVWLETGLVGVLSFVWFIARMVKNCMINIFNKADETINHILMAGVAATAGILTSGMAEYVWFTPRLMLAFWAVVGIILAGLGILAARREVMGR